MNQTFGKRATVQGKRGYTRLPVALPVTVAFASATRSCLLDDISVTGARVRSDAPVLKGASAELRFADWRVFCTVAWVRGRQAGLHFADPLATRDMEQLRWIVDNREEWESANFVSAARNWAEGMGRAE